MPARPPGKSSASSGANHGGSESVGPSRLTVGIVSILCWILAAVSYIFLNSETPSLLSGAAARVGLLFGALWLSMPVNGRLQGRTLWPVGIVLLLVMFIRGRMLLYIVPLLAVTAFLAMLIRPKSNRS